ncbi:STAS domain-containing protein [Actinoplanes sp. NPDC049316]|uniref:STAS domain-containing protein n=1 Tax=Actinoplanes sp. NPDC049316 TaxID=3154727 RepID=UPI0034481C4A
MTAVSTTHSPAVELTCDGCGTTTTVDGCGWLDADVVYVPVAAVGWTGSPYARGQHRCPSCAAGDASRPALPRQPGPRDEAPAHVALTVTSPAVLIRVTGDIDLDLVPDLRTGLETAVALRPYVIVDLTAARTVDSLGLGALVRGRSAARQRGGDLLLVAPSRFVQTVVRTMRLHRAFRMFDTVPQAITAALAADDAVPSGAGS